MKASRLLGRSVVECLNGKVSGSINIAGAFSLLLGASLFVIGYVVNRYADWMLRRLRKPGESGYEIPRGGLFRWISCPNYLGEMLIWVGWVVATWSWPALAFAVWTIADLLPRSWSHHKWYRARFGDYPSGRKVLLPGVW